LVAGRQCGAPDAAPHVAEETLMKRKATVPKPFGARLKPVSSQAIAR
jgi:hypothetical protein